MDKRELVEIVSEETGVVKTVFGLYRNGNSFGAISSYLFSRRIFYHIGQCITKKGGAIYDSRYF